MLHLDHASPWVFGLLANNVWSTTDGKQGGTYNNGLLQPFLNYNFKGGLYLTSSPILTANWKAEESGDIWTVPVGGGWYWQDLPLRQTAGQFDLASLLQRGKTRVRG